MKKYLLSLIALLISIPASASVINVSPSAATLTVGSSFNVSVSVDPQSSSIYTAKASLSFPADMLVVESWAFAPSWSPLSQPGYDTTDNSGGSLIKTAGYPGGLSTAAQLGTVRFRVLKEGTANISIVSGSALYDEESENALTGRGTASFNLVSASSPAPVIERQLDQPAAQVSTAKPVAATTTVAIATTSPIASVATATPVRNQDNLAVLVDRTRDDTVPFILVSILLAFAAGFISGNAFRRTLHQRHVPRRKP